MSCSITVYDKPDINIQIDAVDLVFDGSGFDPSQPLAIAPVQFAQVTAATEWVWTHNLGFRPIPRAYNLAYQEIDAEIEHTSINQLRVRVNPAMPGYIFV